MSMAAVNRAFVKALEGKASPGGCIMTWERGDDGKQRQRLTCFVTMPNGAQKTLTGLYDGRADLVLAAQKLAAEFATDQNIKAPAREVWDAQEVRRGKT